MWLFLPLLGLTACEKENRMDIQDLPAFVSDFVNVHFGDQQIVRALREYEDYQIRYKVFLKNGVRLAFNPGGEMIEIAGDQMLPDSIIPGVILSFVSERYPTAYITGLELGNALQWAVLSNSLKLEFDRKGSFIRIVSAD